jgi:2-keto-3-deoxy-L-fuconate dehydrogenase
VRDNAAVVALAQRLGPLDALFNCAGMVANGSLLDCSEEDWDLSFDLNVKSMFRMTRAFFARHASPRQRTPRWQRCSIINMASHGFQHQGLCEPLRLWHHQSRGDWADQIVGGRLRETGVARQRAVPGTVDTPSLRGRIAGPDPVQAEKDFIARSRWAAWLQWTTSHPWLSSWPATNRVL